MISNNRLLSTCKKLVEKRSGLGDPNEWTRRDFEQLSSLIEEKSGISLSISTLKRLWQGQGGKKPQKATLDGLAVFTGYGSWHDFKISIDSSGNLSNIELQKQKWIYKNKGVRLIIILIIFLGIVVSGLLYFNLIGNKTFVASSVKNIKFDVRNPIISGVPNTIYFDYDIAGNKPDSLWVQLYSDPNSRENLDPDGNYYSSVYYYPGYHKARLYYNGQIIAEQPVFIPTKNWLTFLRYEWQQLRPMYILNEDLVSNGIIQMMAPMLENYPIDPGRIFIVSYLKVAEFQGINGNNFILDSRIKNSIEDGSMTCQISRITVMCENGRYVVPLADPQCMPHVNLRIADIFINGHTNDLTSFGCDLNIWQNVRLSVKDLEAEIFLNDALIYKVNFTKNLGNLIGLEYSFYGYGAVDYAILRNLDDKIIFEENFN